MFGLFKRNNKAVAAHTVHEVQPIEVVQSDIATALVLCMEQYLQEASNVPTNIPSRDALDEQLQTLVSAGLGQTVNARAIQAKLNEYNTLALNAAKARNLFYFVKYLRREFGEKTLLVGSEQFYDVCKKYKLTTGLLSEYTGVIPDSNIREIMKVKSILRQLGMSCDLGLPEANGVYYKIHGIEYGYNDSHDVLKALQKYIKAHNGLLIGEDTKTHLLLSKVIDRNPGMPDIVEQFEYSGLVSFRCTKVSRRDLFIACPPSQLNNPEITITKKAADPIVFQPCTYGIVIHSMWGEEAEDKVFEEYKRINNLML